MSQVGRRQATSWPLWLWSPILFAYLGVGVYLLEYKPVLVLGMQLFVGLLVSTVGYVCLFLGVVAVLRTDPQDWNLKQYVLEGPAATERRLLKPVLTLVWWKFWAFWVCIALPTVTVWAAYGLSNQTVFSLVMGFTGGILLEVAMNDA